LPLELVLHVITCSLPKYPNVLLRPSHPITQTLLSFTLVCHETRRLANRYLRQHCVYLASETSLRSYLLTIPGRPDLRNINSLLLAPFGPRDTIDDQPTAFFVRELFNYTCTNLKRLVIDIPLRSLDPEDDHLGVRQILRAGFERLENLEELVSVRDELYLNVSPRGDEPEVWTGWQRLRHLALYNVDADEDFWSDVAHMPQLESLVLTRADGLGETDIKAQYFNHSQRPLRILLVNVEDDHVKLKHMPRASWATVDPENVMTIMRYNVPCLFDDDD
ncbi:hypothetical protein BS50DRAFT_477034, partial [Corynespora cassiicola Philippines]